MEPTPSPSWDTGQTSTELSSCTVQWIALACWCCCNPHEPTPTEHELSQLHLEPCAFSSAQAQPDPVPHEGQRVQGCCSDQCSWQTLALGEFLLYLWGRAAGMDVQGSGNRNKTGWSPGHSIFCPDWHNDSCSRALIETMRTDVADLYCPCSAAWVLGGKLLGRDQH